MWALRWRDKCLDAALDVCFHRSLPNIYAANRLNSKRSIKFVRNRCKTRILIIYTCTTATYMTLGEIIIRNYCGYERIILYSEKRLKTTMVTLCVSTCRGYNNISYFDSNAIECGQFKFV